MEDAVYSATRQNPVASSVVERVKVRLFAYNLYGCIFDFMLAKCLVSFIVLGIIVIVEGRFITVDDCR
jgi:hypothetical protein